MLYTDKTPVKLNTAIAECNLNMQCERKRFKDEGEGMKRFGLNLKMLQFITFILLCIFMSSFIHTNVAIAADGQSAQATEKPISIDFNDVDISVLIKFISELTGKNFLLDNNVRGKVTIVSPTKISVEEAYRVFEAVLEVNGFAAVPAGNVTKIVPSTEARSKSIETRVQPEELEKEKDPEDKLVTQLIPLTYADAAQVKTLFTPLVSKSSVILAYADTNTLIVTDYKSNIARLLLILSELDVPGIGREVTVIPLEFADATKMVKTLASVFRTSTSNGKGVADKTLQFVADERTNTVVFVASEDDTSRIKDLIALLDRDTPKGKGNIRVYYLEHATAEDMAAVLQDLPKGKTTTQAGAETTVLSENINITADKATNSLIIMANSEDYQVLEEIIQQLDIPRSMVYIETLIMEVKETKEFDVGVEWTVFGNTEVDGKDGIVGGSFSTSGGLDTTDLIAPDGMALGVAAGGVEITTSLGTYTVPNLGALIKAVEKDKDVHILSKPKLLTTDNEEATIVVGDEVPYQTTFSTTDNNTFNSVEYKDVGLTLKITPHISKDRMVRLKIFQELKSATSGTDSLTPTTSERSVETTVIVQDRKMLVIGGLIDETIDNTIARVPLLGRIPLLGRLFRYDTKDNRKSNLYIFISPRVVKNPQEADTLLAEEKEKMTSVEKGLVKMYTPKTLDEISVSQESDSNDQVVQ